MMKKQRESRSASKLSKQVRQGDTFCFGNEFHVRGRRGSARDADFRAHHQRDLGEAPESHGGSGKSVDGTTASPGQTRFGAMRKRL